jgi:hypothetical protein
MWKLSSRSFALSDLTAADPNRPGWLTSLREAPTLEGVSFSWVDSFLP